MEKIHAKLPPLSIRKTCRNKITPNNYKCNSTNCLGYKKDWKKLEFFSNDARLLQENVSKRYPLEQRLTLGLPITKEEYHKQQKILIKK